MAKILRKRGLKSLASSKWDLSVIFSPALPQGAQGGSTHSQRFNGLCGRDGREGGLMVLSCCSLESIVARESVFIDLFYFFRAKVLLSARRNALPSWLQCFGLLSPSFLLSCPEPVLGIVPPSPSTAGERFSPLCRQGGEEGGTELLRMLLGPKAGCRCAHTPPRRTGTSP